MQYAERVGHFLAANQIIDAERKGAMLLSAVSPKSYQQISSLVIPAKPGGKTIDELIEVMLKHHRPKPSPIVQQYKFHTRWRCGQELNTTYILGLRAIPQMCQFGNTLRDMLCDHLVCGINDDNIQ